MSQMLSSTPLKTKAEIEQLAAHYIEVMQNLIATIQQETDLVREGHLGPATRLGAVKGELAQLYIADTLRLRANQARMAEIAPDLLELLRRQHDAFRSSLQINLTVLATAHAVSEGIVRGVSGELARKSSPSTYGATGRANAPNPRAATPMAVSRSL